MARYRLLIPKGKWNGKIVAIEGGHGADTFGKRTPYIKSLGRQIKEHEFNEPVANQLAEELLRSGFKVLLIAIGDYDMPLSERTKLANRYNADAYVSIHFNAFDGKFNGNDPSGISLHIYPGQRNKSAGKLAESIEKYLKQGTKQTYRGIKENDFHVLRETEMAAILSENGFMDNEREAKLMINKAFQREVAVEHAKGICDYFNVVYKRESNSSSGSSSKPSSSTYTIKKGDTFWGIEEDLNIKHGTLEKLNPSIDPKELKLGQGIKISETKTKPAGTFLIKVKAVELWYYSKPDWNAKKDTVKRNEVFTVVKTLTVNGSKMYKLKSGTYITANPKYVEIV